MNNVFGEIVLSERDVNFLTKQTVKTIRLRHGASCHQRQIRTGLRLGQIHCARPSSTHERLDIRLFLSVRASQQQGLDHAICQHRAQRKRDIRSVQIFSRGGRKQLGQPLTSPLLWVSKTLPAAFYELFKRFVNCTRHAHLSGITYWRFAITDAVGRRDNLRGEFRILLEDRINQV